MKDYEKWFKKAEGDLLDIKNNFSAKEIAIDTACFHVQQAAEKYMKGYLVSKGVNFPKTHDLELLLDLCVEKDLQFSQLLPEIKNLNDYAILPRYPDEMHDLTVTDAQQAHQNAVIIKDFVLKHFFE
ncbi:MAG TPA: HEPN domain-containing protein [Puia sp.]|jgi:HEPN domain-containing protein|nr:HEPN domain-containing protein [Puia sp.]